MANKLVEDDNVRILLDRRKEIRDTINKLEAEYTSIGNILRKLYNYEHDKQIDEDNER